ncbi:unnamed protein product, partial [marine sediment metagenome]
MEYDNLKRSDEKVYEALLKEIERVDTGLTLIPSENSPSRAVHDALGTVFNDKYADGYPGNRDYVECQIIDLVENLAIERAKKLFGAEHVNVQPYCGTIANIEIYNAMMNPGETFMGLSVEHGGDPSHGDKASLTSRLFNAVQYGVDRTTSLLDYDVIRETALAVRPKVIVCGLSAYPREINFKAFSEIAEEVGAILLADISHIAGLVAGGIYQSPFPYADVVMTTTHKSLKGPRGAIIMCKEKFAKAIDESVYPRIQGGPLENVIAAKAVAFGEALKPEFKIYANQIIKNAKGLAESLMENGFRLTT